MLIFLYSNFIVVTQTDTARFAILDRATTANFFSNSKYISNCLDEFIKQETIINNYTCIVYTIL